MSWVKAAHGELVNLDDVRKICIEEISSESDLYREGEMTHMVAGYSPSTADDDQPDYIFWLGDEDSAIRHMQRIFSALPKITV